MVAYTEHEMLREIRAYMEQAGGGPETWRAGLTRGDVELVLEEHGVDLETDVWIWRRGIRPKSAQAAFTALVQIGVAPLPEEPQPDEPDEVDDTSEDHAPDTLFLFRPRVSARATSSGEPPSGDRPCE